MNAYSEQQSSLQKRRELCREGSLLITPTQLMQAISQPVNVSVCLKTHKGNCEKKKGVTSYNSSKTLFPSLSIAILLLYFSFSLSL